MLFLVVVRVVLNEATESEDLCARCFAYLQ